MTSASKTRLHLAYRLTRHLYGYERTLVRIKAPGYSANAPLTSLARLRLRKINQALKKEMRLLGNAPKNWINWIYIGIAVKST